MKTLVTGATGFVGVNVVRRLVSRGEDVRILCRKTSNLLGTDGLKIEKAQGDVADYASVQEAVKRCKRVYHVAGIVDMSPFNEKWIYDVNTGGTENVCRAAFEEGCERLVHTSSTAAVGEGTTENPCNEDTPYDTNHFPYAYHKSKHQAEKVVLKYHEKGLPSVIVNPSYMLGPWDIKPSSGRIVQMAVRLGGIPLYPGGSNSMADVEDVAEGHILAMEKGKPGERYILGGENMTYRELSELINEMIGKKRLMIPLLYAAALPFAFFGNVFGRLFPKTFQDVNINTLKMGFIHHCVSSDKAKRELGYVIHPVRGAIEKTLKWFKDHKYL